MSDGILYGCRRLDLTPISEDGSPDPDTTTVKIDVPQECGVEPQVQEGNEATLRGGDKLIAIIEDEDILTGINFTFTNAKLDAEEVQLIGGNGTIKTDAEGNSIGYEAPTMEEQQTGKTPFMAELYVAEYAEGASNKAALKGFVKFTLNYCKGSVPTFTSSDQDFLTPEFTIKARENKAQNLSVIHWEKVDQLPT